MPSLWIAHVNVTDPDEYAKYAKRAGPAIEAHGGKFLARGSRYVQMEGKEYSRNVVVQFESIEAAQACYNSPAYQEALAFAQTSAERSMVFVELIET
ncbi:MAG: DUF1330 domain-containing protein [Pseudomonadota bacterium]